MKDVPLISKYPTKNTFEKKGWGFVRCNILLSNHQNTSDTYFSDYLSKVKKGVKASYNDSGTQILTVFLTTFDV